MLGKIAFVLVAVTSIILASLKLEVYKDETTRRRDSVVRGMRHAWKAYEERAWGADEILPVSGEKKDWLGYSVMIIDSIDTLYLMGMTEEYERARAFVRDEFNVAPFREVPVFETVVRVLGGLLGAYEVSGDQIFLDKAKQFGEAFLPVFRTSRGIPALMYNPGLERKNEGNRAYLAELGSVQLEFLSLANKTGNMALAKKAIRPILVVEKENREYEGMIPSEIDPDTGKARAHSPITYGSKGDSFYEYLLKGWIMTGDKSKIGRFYKKFFDRAMRTTLETMVGTTRAHNFTFLYEVINGNQKPKFDHLACFAGGVFALGAKYLKNNISDELFAVGEGLALSCHKMYYYSPLGLAPEIVKVAHQHPKLDFVADEESRFNLLRPEAIETYFVLWRLTHDQKYRDWGWAIWKAMNKHSKVKYGYAGVENVATLKPEHSDTMPSYFTAETLKYLYLLFSDDDVLPLDKYVFNTEGHPLSIIPGFEF